VPRTNPKTAKCQRCGTRYPVGGLRWIEMAPGVRRMVCFRCRQLNLALATLPRVIRAEPHDDDAA
jgi:hypothetical protein